MIAVSIQDLSWKYSGRQTFALEHLNLDIEQGSFVTIVGPNEGGKTTLLSCVKGLIPASFPGVWRGNVEVFGQDTRTQSAQDLAQNVGLVFSDPEAQFTSMTVEEELVFGLENIGLALGEIDARLHWAAELAMIEDLLDKSPYEISGGQKQRVAIASVLAMRPRIMILDEPTSMLDPRGKEYVFEIMANLKREHDLTLIVVEHNIEQVAPMSDFLVLLADGKIVKAAPPDLFFADIALLDDNCVQTPQVTALFGRLGARGLYDGCPITSFDRAVSTARRLLG